jgi:hypothetical protein
MVRKAIYVSRILASPSILQTASESSLASVYELRVDVLFEGDLFISCDSVVRFEIESPESPRRVTCTGYVQKNQALDFLAADLSYGVVNLSR